MVAYVIVSKCLRVRTYEGAPGDELLCKESSPMECSRDSKLVAARAKDMSYWTVDGQLFLSTRTSRESSSLNSVSPEEDGTT